MSSESEDGVRDDRRIRKVPKVLQLNRLDEVDYYTPKLVSFGPYYHGLEELRVGEELKHEVFTKFFSSRGKDKEFFLREIFKVIDRIRDYCYVGVSKNEYDDQALAEMMLLDTCFAIYLMTLALGHEERMIHLYNYVGLHGLTLVFRDIYLLENQIPLWFIKFLYGIQYGNTEEGWALICDFSIHISAKDSRLKRILRQGEKQPFHLLDAFYRLLVLELENPNEFVAATHRDLELDSAGKRPVKKCQWWPRRKQNPNEFENPKLNCQSRSVTDLKAKGIHFKPSSDCLKDIKFKSYTFYGQLQLPVYLFTVHSKVLFTHMIAFEMTPESGVELTVTFYVSFLKSLIVKSEDVKELREKKILFSSLDYDEQIVEAIKEIDIGGYGMDLMFDDVRRAIENHCSSRSKTWIAELIYTYFRNPWTVTSLLAATFLLCLTFLQTYYTMNPK
ncbi:UPF0481 protein At3g47200-like [Olea europaea var. sylvestris]|uniref:UPF0481 protein At3g47200-like n=1 Tax=Olea europaea var. sylvestris TaxID=158386 RepID=UPI000C1CE355|nr:UPF0481 protein At3g47200-like [Olea europaea var. sylvestris]XP_022882906.1 UPF0481 protein At3g47200-like [Olea europaea var. sylvestris]